MSKENPTNQSEARSEETALPRKELAQPIEIQSPWITDEMMHKANVGKMAPNQVNELPLQTDVMYVKEMPTANFLECCKAVLKAISLLTAVVTSVPIVEPVDAVQISQSVDLFSPRIQRIEATLHNIIQRFMDGAPRDVLRGEYEHSRSEMAVITESYIKRIEILGEMQSSEKSSARESRRKRLADAIGLLNEAGKLLAGD